MYKYRECMYKSTLSYSDHEAKLQASVISLLRWLIARLTLWNINTSGVRKYWKQHTLTADQFDKSTHVHNNRWAEVARLDANHHKPDLHQWIFYQRRTRYKQFFIIGQQSRHTFAPSFSMCWNIVFGTGSAMLKKFALPQKREEGAG